MFPDQGSNLKWEHGMLSIGPPGKSQGLFSSCCRGLLGSPPWALAPPLLHGAPCQGQLSVFQPSWMGTSLPCLLSSSPRDSQS